MWLEWLTGIFTGHQKKDTEIKKLKSELCQTVEQAHRAAAAGDKAAAQQLDELERTITEQSVRFLRQNAKEQ